MRTIKFRARSIEDGKWLIGSLIPNGKCTAFIAPFGMGFHLEEVDPETVGQFTGLRDIKGTEIYDGDILDTKTSDYVPNGYSFICKWIDSGFALIYQGRTYGSKEKNNWLNKYPLCQKNVEDLIIMGNIFDNPELVK